ncbi:MAG: hypothetical protein JXK94_03175 [Deltaproteobacteria bacterium]|nr:hypothetical protein [Deltaproteobacteria bacterium]
MVVLLCHGSAKNLCQEKLGCKPCTGPQGVEKRNYSAQGLVPPMERASAARMAAAKPHGWVPAALGMGDARHCADKLNNY